MNFMDLVELVFSWEQWEKTKQFKENTTKAPHIHFIVVVTVSKKAFWGSVPTSGDVLGVGLFTVDTSTRAEVNKFNIISF